MNTNPAMMHPNDYLDYEPEPEPDEWDEDRRVIKRIGMCMICGGSFSVTETMISNGMEVCYHCDETTGGAYGLFSK